MFVNVFPFEMLEKEFLNSVTLNWKSAPFHCAFVFFPHTTPRNHINKVFTSHKKASWKGEKEQLQCCLLLNSKSWYFSQWKFKKKKNKLQYLWITCLFLVCPSTIISQWRVLQPVSNPEHPLHYPPEKPGVHCKRNALKLMICIYSKHCHQQKETELRSLDLT